MFFTQLEVLCKEQNTTPTAVILKLGYSKGSMSYWKKGKCPSGDIVVQFANYFNVSTDYLLTGKEFNASNNAHDVVVDSKNEMTKNVQSIAPSDEEKRVLDYYLRLNRENKDLLMGKMVEFLREQASEEKKEIIEGKMSNELSVI